MPSIKPALPTNETVRKSRLELADTIREIYAQKLGAKATMIGSLTKGNWDAFSDIDIWISVPDDAMEEALRTRTDSFSSVGPDLLRWERPSFAPINGLHSIVLYESSEVTPTEVDYYIAPESMSDYYADFISCTRSRAADYMWARGQDDMAPHARIDYGILVTSWAGKYWYRGEDRSQQLRWAWDRFRSIADEVGIDKNIEQRDSVTDLSRIAEAYQRHAAETSDLKRVRVCEKIIDTLHLIDVCE